MQDLTPLLLEIQKGNNLTQQLLSEERGNDEPRQRFLDNMFEIINARDLNSRLKDKIEKETDENEKHIGEKVEELAVANTSAISGKDKRSLANTVLESDKTVNSQLERMIKGLEDNGRAIIALGENLIKMFDVTYVRPEISKLAASGGGTADAMDAIYSDLDSMTAKFSEITNRIDQQVFPFEPPQPPPKPKTASEASSEEDDMAPKTAGKEDEKKEVKRKDNRFTTLSRGFTKNIGIVGEKIDKLTDGILGKIGLATILTALFGMFVTTFPAFATAATKVIIVLGKFFNDLGMLFKGEMGFGQFLKENLVAIAGFFLLAFRKFIIKKLFGGLIRRIGASIRLIGMQASGQFALGGKLLLKLIGRFFLIPMLIFEAITGFFDGYQKKISEGGGFMEAIGAGLTQAIKNIGLFFLDGIMMIADGLTYLFEPIVNAIAGGIGEAIKFFKNLIFGNEEVEGRFMGGPVAAGSPYIIGEKGPELFVPGASGNIVANGAMGGGAPIIVTNNNVSAPNVSHSHQHSNVNITDSQQEIIGL